MNAKPNPVVPAHEADRREVPPGEKKPVRLGRIALVAAVLIIVGFIVGFLPRLHARRTLVKETADLAVPTVEVVSPKPGQSSAGVSLPAEIRAYVEAPIYARANGYLKRWLVDLGAAVTEGQLLAEIDTPEVDQQLAQAKADLARDQASLELAQTTSARWNDLLKTASVSEQETAEKTADLALKKALVDGAHANARRLEELKGFARVTAPFAGTVTARETDIGQLITAGSGRELFRVAKTNPLRVYVQVPQSLSRSVAIGQTTEVAISELPGRKLEAKVVRTAGVMAPGSRTLLTELELDNSRGEVLAGSYAQVRFPQGSQIAALTLPANVLLFRAEGTQVGVVGPDGKVELRPVKVGRDFGQTMEMIEGVGPHDRVIMNPSDSLTAGVTVHVAEPPKALAEK
jgi:RND family efflux transporter MFP subunit